MINDQVTMALMYCFLLEGIAFGEFGLGALSWWRLCYSYKE
jgi:hypothetical protein